MNLFLDPLSVEKRVLHRWECPNRGEGADGWLGVRSIRFRRQL